MGEHSPGTLSGITGTPLRASKHILLHVISHITSDLSYSGFAATFIGRTIKYTTSSFTTKFELQQVETSLQADDRSQKLFFFQLKEFQGARKSELGSSTRDVEQAVESVENNVKWMERNYDNILMWLQKKTLHQY